MYGTVQSHKGVINVYSNIGVGTEFKIYLPLSNAVVEYKKHDTVKSATVTAGTVLVVDDEAVSQKVCCDMLAEIGCNTLTANNGEEAVEIYKDNVDNIDLILLDVVMPKLNGSEAYFKIIEINPEAKVVFFTGYNSDEKINELTKNGEIDMLIKPFKFKQLSEIISKNLTQPML